MRKYKNNPIAIRNAKIEALEDAKEIFINTLEQFSSENIISSDELNAVRNLVEAEYINKRLSYLIEHKTERFSEYLNDALGKISFEEESETTFTRLSYIRHTRQLLSND